MTSNLDALSGALSPSGPEIEVLLLDVASKSTVLLALVFLVVQCCRRASAAVRHRLWTLGIWSAIALPMISFVAPIWRIPVLPKQRLVEAKKPGLQNTMQGDRSGSRESMTGAALPALADPSNGRRPSLITPSRGRSALPKTDRVEGEQQLASKPRQPGGDVSAAAVAGFQTPWFTPGETATRIKRIAHWFAVAWLTVSGLLLVRLGVSWGQTVRLTRRASSIGDRRIVVLAQQCLARCQGRLRVQVRQSSEVSTPIAAGVFRAAVVLPAEARSWSDQRLKAVLLHELAHIARRDVLSQLAACICCAMYWFNPMAWFVAARLQLEREQACDDQVLQWGVKPTDYAQQLLQITRLYRRNSQRLLSVAMARPTQIEQRIRGVLDSARSRIGLRPSVAVGALAAFCLATGLLATLRPVSTAAESPQAGAGAAQSEESNGDARQQETPEAAKGEIDESDQRSAMIVSAVDENGNALSGVEIHASIYDPITRPPSRVYITGNDGIAKVFRPDRLRRLQLEARKPAYVPLFASWKEDKHDHGREVPEAFTLTMVEGSEIGGRIIDSGGNPIEDAEVSVRVDVEDPLHKKLGGAKIATRLTDDPIVTDKDGRWSVTNAPSSGDADAFRFRTRVTHPEFVSDSSWGGLQQESGVTTRQLRNQAAEITMPSGARIRGRVIGADGTAVDDGIVVWADDPYFTSGGQEAKVQPDGSFETKTLAIGLHPLTIVAPGFQPHLEEVDVYPEMEEKTFRLQPGKSLTLKITDAEGEPIPRAWVGVRGWRGKESLYNHDHSSVLDSGIPLRADENGIYRWDGAPVDAVRYAVSARGYTPKSVELTAKEEPYQIRLSPEVGLTGRVTDAETGLPIPRFRVIPVNVYRPGFLSADYHNAAVGHDGQYPAEELNTTFHLDDRAYRIRIEAEGYRSAMSEKEFRLADGSQEIHFQLQPADPLAGKVVDAEGRPVEDASVVVATPTVLPHFNRGYSRTTLGVPASTRTGADGRFEWYAQFEPVRIRITHDVGFAELRLGPESRDLGTIQLKPWAEISGVVTRDGNPLVNERVQFRPLDTGQLGEPRFQDSYMINTDGSGAFSFDRIPPVAGSVGVFLSPWQDSELTSARSVPLQPAPGQQITLRLEGEGADVTGKVVPTGRDGAPLDLTYSLNYLIRRGGGIELPGGLAPEEFDLNGPVKPEWFLDPNSRHWLASKENHFVKLSPSGEMDVRGVAPGRYDLSVRLYEKPAGCLVESIGHAVVPLRITERDVRSGAKDIGRIEVPCRVGPSIGQSMASYRFTDKAGRVRTIRDLGGQHVVVQFWASWCAPCLESMPSIQRTVRQSDPSELTIAAINLDHDRTVARQMARDNGWSWANDFVGSSSEIAQQLAISSVPAYFLIGPDGELISTAGSWREMNQRLKERQLISE